MTTRVLREFSVIDKPASRSVIDYDVVCVGFGSSSIALAIALQETAPNINILFIERQPQSSYVSFSRSPGTYMQLSFLNDLVTHENPRSKFSFVSYLQATNQLIKFTNLGNIRPLREQFSRYLVWCAGHFNHQVQYGTEVQAIRPSSNVGSINNNSLVKAWDVECADTCSGERTTVSARQVICAVGMQPKIPSLLSSPAILSSVFPPSALPEVLSKVAKPYRSQHHLIVIGEGPEAAEATEMVHDTRSPLLKVTWLQRKKPHGSPGAACAMSDRLHEYQYAQRIREQDPCKWKLRILTDVEIKSISRNAEGNINLVYGWSGGDSEDVIADCDSIVAATGYTDTGCRMLLEPLRGLLYRDELSINDSQTIKFKKGYVQNNCGIWLLGANRSITDTYDSSMAHIATSSRELAQALLQKLNVRAENWDQRHLRQLSSNQGHIHKARL